jgi:hypothetical protein
MLLIALLATGSLSETGECTKILANLKSENKRCPLTGKKTFASALTAVLASSETAKQVGWIEADRAWHGAVIVYSRGQKDKGYLRSVFGHHRIGLTPGLSEKAELWLPFDKIAEGLAVETQASKSSR